MNDEQKKTGPHLMRHEQVGFNGRLALIITSAVGTMWCAYIFAIIALISLPAAFQGGVATLISWIAQTFLQLVLLSVIMVGQRVAAETSDKQAKQTYRDAETLLALQRQVRDLIEENKTMTQEIRDMLVARKK